MTKWHKGPPPSVGWWQASAFRDPSMLRWWNGSYWSECAWKGCTERHIEHVSSNKAGFELYEIEWKDRPKSWPARSKT